MILRYQIFLVLACIIISIGIGIGNLSSDKSSFMSVSHRSLLVFAQTSSATNDENNNQTQQQQWVDKINNIRSSLTLRLVQ